MKIRKLLIALIIIIAILGTVILVHYTRLTSKYNYTAESVADFRYTLRNLPPYVYAKQGLKYIELRNGIIVRLDQVYGSGNTLTESIAYGIPEKYGTYYIYRDGLCLYESTGEATRYYPDEENNLLSDTTQRKTEIYYLNFSGERFLCVSSTEGYATDNGMSPPVKLEKNGTFITYLTPVDLNRNYEITIGNTCITGDYLSGELSRKGGGSWY